MIDPTSEPLLTLTQASKLLPGRPPRPTIARWCRRGFRGIILDSIKVKGRLWTSSAALERFKAEVARLEEG